MACCKLLLVCVAAAAFGVATARSVGPNEGAGGAGRAAQDSTSWLGDLRSAYRVYSECAAQDLSTCLKLKLVSALDRAARSANDVEVVDGVSLVRDPASAAEGAAEAATGPKSEQQLSEELPRALGDRDDALNGMIADRALSFLQSHTLQLKFPSGLAEEGRKKKNMGGLLLLPLLMGAMMVPLALGGLALLAGKALLVSKLALVLAGVIGLKKLLSGSHGGGDYQVVSGHHHGRSMDAAHDLAYRAHAPAPSA